MHASQTQRRTARRLTALLTALLAACATAAPAAVAGNGAAALALGASGPARAVQGEMLTYTLTVANTGAVSFAQDAVRPSADRCGAAPARVSAGADATPDALDPGDRWEYECQVATARGEREVVLAAIVTASAADGRSATATAVARTALRPARAGVNPSSAASARISGSTGCARGRYAVARVQGPGLRQVTFRLDGRVVRTISAPNRGGAFELRVPVRRVRAGRHEIRATVTFGPGTQAADRTLRLVFSRCSARCPR